MKKKVIITICLLLYVGIILFPPLAYGYVYPNQGDDSAYHLQFIDRLKTGDMVYVRYIGQLIVSYPIIWLNQLTGWSVDSIFLWVNYAILALVGLAVYGLVKYLTNWKAGLLAIPLVIFTSIAILFQFNAGVIFSVITIGLFLPLDLYLIIRAYQKKKAWFWAITTVIVGITIMFHTIGGLGVGAVLQPVEAIKGLPITANAVIVAEGVLSKAITEYTPSFATFIFQIFGITASVCMAASTIIIIRHQLRLSQEQKIAVIILGLASILVGIIAFSGFTAFSSRLAWYLGVIMTLLSAVLVGIVINQKKLANLALIVGIFIIASSVMPIWGYTQDNSLVKEPDLQAIAYINNLPGKHYSTSPEVAYWVYDRFIDGKEFQYGAYPYIERNQMMTFRTNPVVNYYWYKYPEFKPNGEPQGFSGGGLEVNVYNAD